MLLDVVAVAVLELGVAGVEDEVVLVAPALATELDVELELPQADTAKTAIRANAGRLRRRGFIAITLVESGAGSWAESVAGRRPETEIAAQRGEAEQAEEAVRDPADDAIGAV